jgi:hypothetical protein
VGQFDQFLTAQPGQRDVCTIAHCQNANPMAASGPILMRADIAPILAYPKPALLLTFR